MMQTSMYLTTSFRRWQSSVLGPTRRRRSPKISPANVRENHIEITASATTTRDTQRLSCLNGLA